MSDLVPNPKLDVDNPDVRKALLNTETAKIAWRELQRYFASGAAIAVAPELDLLAVAAEVMADNKGAVESWISEDKLGPVSDQQALQWYDGDVLVWAVVLSPWVFVQLADH